MLLPSRSRPAEEILADLDALKQHDVRWKDGRAFSLAYYAGPDVTALGDEAYRRFSSDNALNTDAFPSLRTIQSDVVAMVAALLDGGPDAAGFMTTGGTESLLMAVKAARERGRAERGIARPNIVLPASAHAAFEKGCHYFGLESRRVDVRADWRADVDAMADAADDDTVLVVGSAPQYPQGVIDPIEAIAALADDRRINCHVDACMGGMVLPYLARLGEDVPPWSFAVPGVTSISVDLHKFGYTTKGASVIVHRSRELRSHQTFVTSDWLGGTYGSSGVLGTKGGGAMAAAWAVMNHLGDDGYLRLAGQARRATLELAAAIEACPELEVRAPPDAMIVAFGAVDPERLDVFALADQLWRRGWYVDRQQPPDSLHCTVNAVHDGLIATFDAVLHAAIDDVHEADRNAAVAGTVGSYGTVE
jgi:glutamate/tyrosine decarboxylase-like PLP-dependent enzyme